MRWIATCPDDTKSVLVGELEKLGATGLRPLYRGVSFEADLELAYRAHLWLRTASRIQRVVAELPARTVTELAQGAAAVDWKQFLLARKPFTVAPILTDAEARQLGEEAVQSAIAQEVQRAFPGGGGPRFEPEADEPMTLVAHVRSQTCTLGLETAGRALHKRGWRLPGHPAVLKETLAASLLLLAGYDGTEPLLDPMCGSGTIAIEGAYIALHKAPLIHRGKDDFAFEHQAGFDRALWRRVQDQARAAKLPAPPAPIFASDVRGAYVKLARETALRARVEKHMQFSTGSFFALDPPAPSGLIVANLPYGERIGHGALHQVLRDTGKTLRDRFSKWRAALLVPAGAPLGELGMRPKQIIPLMNGALEVQLVLL
jgi:putative N6-adenine-specific DNA methylase